MLSVPFFCNSCASSCNRSSLRATSTRRYPVFQWSKKLNMENVAKITYKSSKKSVVSVNKNGKITGKKKGTGKVTAEVTLKDGTKKTVKMKVKVK